MGINEGSCRPSSLVTRQPITQHDEVHGKTQIIFTSQIILSSSQVVVLAVASLCLAEPEADPLHYYAPYGYAYGHHYPYVYHPYAASGYAGPLPGHSYQAVHRLHKREAEADPQVLVAAAPVAAPLAAAAAAPYVNDGPVSGPLTPAVGDLVATPKGFRSLALEGFSEDLNEDGFVDPIAPAVAAPVVTPVVHAAPVVQAAPVVAPAPVAPVAALPAQVAPVAPFLNRFFPSAPLAAPAVVPALHTAPAVAVAHAPVVKSVVETPATVAHSVAPLLHAAPVHVPAVHAPLVRNPHVIKPFVHF